MHSIYSFSLISWFFSLIHLIRNSSPPLSSNSSLTKRSTKCSNTSVYAQLSVVCGRRLFDPRKGRLALRNVTVIGRPIQHRCNITTTRTTTKITRKITAPKYAYFNSLWWSIWFLLSYMGCRTRYSLPTMTGFWFPILIHQWITYQGVGSGAARSVLCIDFKI